MKRYIWLLVVFFIFLVTPYKVNADSSYVLPYPSFMPGNKIYSLYTFVQQAQEYWHFGNLSRAKYYQSQADRYLVEAKILFEYRQYLLANEALKKSNDNYLKELYYLNKTKTENKDVPNYFIQFKEQTEKHIEELEKIKGVVPENFVWNPENATPTQLSLGKDIQSAIELRKECL